MLACAPHAVRLTEQATSAAGKTQLAMQLALCVQLPQQLGGASGAACFLSTSWTLPTNRLVEIIDNHPSLSPSLCGLADIHTMKTPTIPLLLRALSQTFPAFLEGLKMNPRAKPVKLIVIDAITELFHSDEQVSSATLAERSKNLNEIATLLHALAHKHGLAVVVLNEVSDVIDREPPPDRRPHEVSYRDLARLFNRADSIPAEKSKEAALGLVWANQINARIMLTRTDRVRTVDDVEYRPAKRRRVGDAPESVASDPEPVRVRRLSVIFNSLAPPASLDYIITQGGFVALEGSEELRQASMRVSSPVRKPPDATPAPLDEVCPLDLPFAVEDSDGPSSDIPSSLPSSWPNVVGAEPTTSDEPLTSDVLEAENGPQDEDEWDAYWKSTDLGSDFYDQLDLDALSSDRPAN